MGKLENGTIVRVTASDYESRRLQGDLMEVMGYSKSYDSYYLKAKDGQTCCYIEAGKLEVVEDGNKGE